MCRPATLLLLLWGACLPATTWAWGARGHKAVADIATAHLTPQALAQVSELLRDDLDRDLKPSGRTSLADVASWPDEIREIAPDDAYKGWHSRANPVCSEALAPCPDGHCVDQLILHYAAVLKDRQHGQRERNEALKWVVHLVGDLHMPMHSGAHGKAPEATLEGRVVKEGSTLHNVWDSALANAALAQGEIVAAYAASAPLADDAPTQWMRETREIARRFVYAPLPEFDCARKLPRTVQLDRAYQKQSVPVIREQIRKAGLRLAQLLNETLR